MDFLHFLHFGLFFYLWQASDTFLTVAKRILPNKLFADVHYYILLNCTHYLPYLGILCAWTTTQMLRGSCWPPLRQTGEDNWVVPVSHGSAPFIRIWNITITLPEAADLAQNRPLWRMMSTYGATQSWVACQKRRRRTHCVCDYRLSALCYTHRL